MSLNLMLHCGGIAVDREQLAKAITPAPTDTHVPIPHIDGLNLIQETLAKFDFRVVSEAHGLSHEGNRYFGMLEVENGKTADDHSLVVGVCNSHDMRLPFKIACGGGVFVCDNLSFLGEIKVFRKHTKFIMRDIEAKVMEAIGKLGGLRQKQEDRFSAYKGTELTNAQVNDLLVRSVEARAIPVTKLPKVLKEWQEPRHPEFKERTAWSLFNGYTEVLKETNLFDLPKRTKIVHGLMDGAAGLVGATAEPSVN